MPCFGGRAIKYMCRVCGFDKYETYLSVCWYSHLDKRGSRHTEVHCRVFLMTMEEIKEQYNASIFTASFPLIELLVAISNGGILDYDCDKRLVWVMHMILITCTESNSDLQLFLISPNFSLQIIGCQYLFRVKTF